MNKCELHGNNRCDECNYILQLQKRINELVVECNKWKAQTIQGELGDELRAAQARVEMLEAENIKWSDEATYWNNKLMDSLLENSRLQKVVDKAMPLIKLQSIDEFVATIEPIREALRDLNKNECPDCDLLANWCGIHGDEE